jgi:hypothetical protein
LFCLMLDSGLVVAWWRLGGGLVAACWAAWQVAWQLGGSGSGSGSGSITSRQRHARTTTVARAYSCTMQL